MSIVISGVNNNDKITASDGTIDLLSGVTYNSEITVPSLKLGSNIQLGNAGIITATSFAGNISGNITGTTGTFGDFVNIGSNIQLGNAGVVTATTFVGNVTGNVNNTGNLLLQIGGGEKVRITSTGRVGINSTNPSAPLEIYTAASAAWKFRIDTTVSDGVGFYQRANGDFEMVLRDASNNVNYIAGTSGALQFATSGSERLRIDSSGRLLISTTSAGEADSSADDLVIGNTSSGNSGLTIVTGTGNNGALFFADSGGTVRGGFRYQHSSDVLQFYSGGSVSLQVKSNGIGLHENYPVANSLTIRGAATDDTPLLVLKRHTDGAQSDGEIIGKIQFM